jgi:hypothetical protein
LLKERADLVTRGSHGAGVVEVMNGMLADDLAGLTPRLGRHSVPIGCRIGTGDGAGAEEKLHAYGPVVLVAGPSGSGKSVLAAGVLGRLSDCGYQSVVFDPEGDFVSVAGAVVLGADSRAPTAQEVLYLLQSPRPSVVVNLRAVPVGRRPEFFEGLLPRLEDLRARTGRPHWVAVGEAHHLLSAARDPAALTLPRRLYSLLFVTVHPDRVAPAVLGELDLVLAVGDPPGATVATYCHAAGADPPSGVPAGLGPGEALVWRRREGGPPVTVRFEPPRAEPACAPRPAASGDLGPDHSFYFRGPEGKLNLRAQNLAVFLQMAEGVDDATWLHHLSRGDYSRWLRDDVGDEALAAQVAPIEAHADLPPRDSRAAVRDAIERWGRMADDGGRMAEDR